MATVVESLSIDTVGTEEEVAEGLKAVLEMEFKEEGNSEGDLKARAEKGVKGIKGHWEP